MYDERFYDSQADSSQASARVVLSYVLDLTGAKTVVDLGCGVGSWLATAKELGATDIRGIDGDYVDRAWLRIAPDEFVGRDLTERVELDSTYDLSMSLEVAEHLPPDRSTSFVADLCRLAPVVLFGAAQPYQGGTNHINEQYLDYWVERFAAEGYEMIDCIRPRFWEHDIAYHYSQNSAIYARPGYLPGEVRGPRMPLRCVHPVLVECATGAPNALRPWVEDLRQLIGSLPAAAKTTWANHGEEIPGVGRLKRTLGR